MSTLSGELSSLATASMVDFYKRFWNPDGSEAHDLLMSPLFTALWGVFAGLVALRAGQLGSAIEVVNRFGSWFYGSILGVFLLAVLAPKVGGRAASCGLVLGLATVFAVVCLHTTPSTSCGSTWWGRHGVRLGPGPHRPRGLGRR